jgi:hypothetical protein
MDELREKAKRSITMKKSSYEKEAPRNEIPNPSLPNSSIALKEETKPDIEDKEKRDPDREVSDTIANHNDSEHYRHVKKETRRSGSSRHRESSRHKSSRHKSSRHRSSRHRDSSHHKKSRRRSSSESSRERRRRRKEHRRRKRSSSSGSRGRHRSSKYNSRRRKRASSPSSSSSSSEDRKESPSGAVVSRPSHPYFSKLSKIRRERLKKQKQERFWDGFQWVSKESIALASQDPSVHLKNADPLKSDIKKEAKIVTGKDLRRVVATNLPLDYGLNQEDLANYLIIKCKENGNDILFRSIFLNYEQNSGIIECMEKEQTDILIKLDGSTLFGHTLRLTKVANENGFIYGGDAENLLQDSAQLTAQAAAIVNSRIRGLQGKETNSNLNLLGDSFSTIKPSKIIKISNAFDRYEEMTPKMFEEMYEDMEEMMLNFGQFNMLKIIRNGEEKLGGRLFL